MRPTPWIVAERHRVVSVPGYESRYGDDFGFFDVPFNGIRLRCLVSGGDAEIPWEHVSVSTRKRVPNWYEMCLVKELFWSEEEVVMQLHVAASRHINVHPHTLHLWRPRDGAIPLPPPIAV